MKNQEKPAHKDSYPKSFPLRKRKLVFLIILITLFSLGAGIYYFLLKKSLPKDQVLATVNGEEIKKRFFEERLKANCLTKTGERNEALNSFAELLILRQEAKKIGVEVSKEELFALFNSKSFPRIKACPEEFLKDVLKSKVREKISPSRQLEVLILSPLIPDEKIEEVIFAVKNGQFPSLWAAANSFFSKEQIENGKGSPLFYTRQLTVTPDSLNKGIFVDKLLFKTAYDLKKEEVSNPLKVSKGPLKDKLVVLKVVQSSESGEFVSFDDWFLDVKRKAKIKIYE